MSQILSNGKPFWLSAYPNEGTLDYFGFRFYRQPLRKYLVRGATANNFKNAKTLIYYGAITYGFRKEFSIGLEKELSEEQYESWQNWYKCANYLYVINTFLKYGEVPDVGFTGATEEGSLYFEEFYNSSNGQFNIHSTYPRIYPEQRNWGYLTQFWRPPLDYFRCVLNIQTCTAGEYAIACYELLSSYSHWDTFKKILIEGVIDRASLGSIQNIIENKNLSDEEKKLATRIIFDKDNITDGENDEYKKNFNLIELLKNEGCEGYYPVNKHDFAMIFSYAHLKNMHLGENDLPWKLLISSITFEIGINRLYTMLGDLSEGGIVKVNDIQRVIKQATQTWLDKNNFSGSISDVEKLWAEKYLNDIDSYAKLFEAMLDDQQLDCAFDGLLQGYMISQITVEPKVMVSDVYLAMTDPYHYFAPQPFFNEKKRIDKKLLFEEFILKVAMWLINEQFDFSLYRMTFGQKAKFILSKSEFDEQFIFQIDARKFSENRGIIEMIDACLCLWRTAGILEDKYE